MCIVMMTPVRMLHAGLFAGRKGGCLSEMVDDARLAILCFLLAVHGSLACSGKEVNQIVGILRDVNWRTLAKQLSLNMETRIDGFCEYKKDRIPCSLTEVLNGYINQQARDSCCEIVEEIAIALTEFPDPRNNEAKELRRKCYSGSWTLDASEPNSNTEQFIPQVFGNYRAWGVIIVTSVVGLLSVLLYCTVFKRTRLVVSDLKKVEDKDWWIYPWQVWFDADKKLKRPNKLKRRHAPGIVIAIVDSGIKTDHIAFRPASGNRVKILPQSWNFVDENEYDISDYDGHGTTCAGIAAGEMAENEGINGEGGVASMASLLICKVYHYAQDFKWENVTKALQYIERLHRENSVEVNVVSMSFGGPDGVPEVENCIDRLTKLGIVCIAAAGNYGDTPGTTVDFPARLGNVIAIGAHNMLWTQPDFAANQNSEGVEYTTIGKSVRAPGISSNLEFFTFEGTSTATPAAAGLIACILERNFSHPQNPADTIGKVKLHLRQMVNQGDTLKSLRPFDIFTDEPTEYQPSAPPPELLAEAQQPGEPKENSDEVLSEDSFISDDEPANINGPVPIEDQQ